MVSHTLPPISLSNLARSRHRLGKQFEFANSPIPLREPVTRGRLECDHHGERVHNNSDPVYNDLAGYIIDDDPTMPATTNTSPTASWQIPEWHNLQRKRLALCEKRVQLQQQFYEAKQEVREPLVAESPKDAETPTATSTNIPWTWDGPLVDGLPHGSGRLVYTTTGQVYRGSLSHGLRHGVGQAVWSNGQVYRGDWDANSRHGTGTHSWPDGRTVTGEWVKGHLSGRCFFQWPDGATYDGQVVEGKKHGRGIHTWAGGRVYSGQYQQGVEHGEGTLTEPDGVSKYRGSFRNGCRHGYGLQLWAHKTYDGEWEHNAVSGKGTLKWHNGAQYTGSFVNGKYHGHGTYRDKDGKSYVGEWKQGVKSGFGTQAWPTGKSYRGMFEHNLRHGYGRMTYADGSVYVGGWYRGERHGQGILVDANGDVLHCGLWEANHETVAADSVSVTSRSTRDDFYLASLELPVTQHHRRRVSLSEFSSFSEAQFP